MTDIATFSSRGRRRRFVLPGHMTCSHVADPYHRGDVSDRAAQDRGLRDQDHRHLSSRVLARVSPRADCPAPVSRASLQHAQPDRLGSRQAQHQRTFDGPERITGHWRRRGSPFLAECLLGAWLDHRFTPRCAESRGGDRRLCTYFQRSGRPDPAQAMVLMRLIQLHALLCAPEMRNFHEELEARTSHISYL